MFAGIRRAWRNWKYVEERHEPTPSDYRKVEKLRDQMIELKKRAKFLRDFNMTVEANAKDEKAAEIQKEISALRATLRQAAA